MAMAVNTPFHQGRDTGYASWRAHVWGSWPSAGPVEPFGDVAGYRAAVDGMVGFGAALDEGMVYFDVRLSPRYPTVEVRVCDVCTDAEVAALVATVARALVQRAAADWRSGATLETWRVDLLRAARWRATRHGLSESLVDPDGPTLRPAADVLGSLVRHTRDALDETGDTAYVRQGVERLLRTEPEHSDSVGRPNGRAARSQSWRTCAGVPGRPRPAEWRGPRTLLHTLWRACVLGRAVDAASPPSSAGPCVVRAERPP